MDNDLDKLINLQEEILAKHSFQEWLKDAEKLEVKPEQSILYNTASSSNSFLEDRANVDFMTLLLLRDIAVCQKTIWALQKNLESKAEYYLSIEKDTKNSQILNYIKEYKQYLSKENN